MTKRMVVAEAVVGVVAKMSSAGGEGSDGKAGVGGGEGERIGNELITTNCRARSLGCDDLTVDDNGGRRRRLPSGNETAGWLTYRRKPCESRRMHGILRGIGERERKRQIFPVGRSVEIMPHLQRRQSSQSSFSIRARTHRQTPSNSSSNDCR